MFEVLDFRLTQAIYMTAVITTFAVSPWSNFDPISLPKMFVLSVGSFAILGLLLGSHKYFLTKSNRLYFLLSFLFVCLMISTVLFSNADFYSQVWGTFGRNTGFLTYLSLIIMSLATSVVQNKTLYERILFVFVFSAIPMVAYCSFQILGLDPIGWSEKFAFGTLGNVNFLSAYFGLTSVCSLVLCTSKKIRSNIRIVLILSAFIEVYIALYTKSIQGPIIFVIGTALAIMLYIISFPKTRLRTYLLFAFSITGVISFLLLIYALVNKGPLASFIYQPSIVFRADYMHAGYKMMLQQPWTGVGLDNYGSWYREVRGEISTLRTGPNRISNSAHNILLDIGSGGGVLLALCYIFLNLLVLVSIVRLLQKGQAGNPIFVASVSVWVAYHVQASISINQIGVGVWGWILSGLIIGLSKCDFDSSQSTHLLTKAAKNTQLDAKVPIFVFFGALFGFFSAFSPLNADIAYRNATKTGQFEKIYAATNKPGSTEFHKELLLDFTQKNRLESEGWMVANEITKRYPRNFYAWAMLSVSSIGNVEEHRIAREKSQKLDPFNPEFKNP